MSQGELTISADMEDLQNHLFMESVPPSWTKRAYPSTLGLPAWFADLLNRITDLANWTIDFNVSEKRTHAIRNTRDGSKVLRAKMRFYYTRSGSNVRKEIKLCLRLENVNLRSTLR